MRRYSAASEVVSSSKPARFCICLRGFYYLTFLSTAHRMQAGQGVIAFKCNLLVPSTCFCLPTRTSSRSCACRLPLRCRPLLPLRCLACHLAPLSPWFGFLGERR